MSLSLSDIQSFPKAELHRHIDGSVPPDALRRMLLARGVRSVRLRTGRVISIENEKEFFEEYCLGSKESVKDFLAVFDMVIETVMQDPDGISEVVYEIVSDCAKENIWYVELTCAPAYHTRGGLGYREVFGAFVRGVVRGRKDTGVIAKLIFGIQREACQKEKPEDKRDPLGIELVKTALALRVRHPEIAGVGLVCDEFLYPPETYEEAFCMTFNSLLFRAVHAGEMGSDEQKKINVRTATEKLRTHRVGHGIPIGSSDDLMRQCIRLNIGVECNPWSNILLKFIDSVEELHIDRMLERGVMVSINSDDPALLQKSLSDNIRLVLDTYRWGEEQLVVLTRNALESAFLAPSEREQLYKEFRRRAGTVL